MLVLFARSEERDVCTCRLICERNVGIFSVNNFFPPPKQVMAKYPRTPRYVERNVAFSRLRCQSLVRFQSLMEREVSCIGYGISEYTEPNRAVILGYTTYVCTLCAPRLVVCIQRNGSAGVDHYRHATQELTRHPAMT